MSYTITTVAEMLGRVNESLFIPGIQRPYVWTQDQIIRLLDSLMRKYPIGTLLLWDLPAESRQDWEIYRFIENFWEGEIHNDRIAIPDEAPCTLVLDGQQRLTSLLIGLNGSYTVRKKHKRRRNVNAWTEVVLHMDLAHAPEGDDEVDDDDSPLAEHYHFRFFDTEERPQNRSGELWFELSFIWSVRSDEDLARIRTSWIDNNTSLTEPQKHIARSNLRRLWEMVWLDPAIAYFTEISTSYDRVLDIFIRANDGGTRLSRSDLLMSVITLRWEKFNAREETEALLDELMELLQPKRAVQREFLLRTALFLNNLDFKIQVKNFTPANIRRLEGNWEHVKASLSFTSHWMRDVGLYGPALGGMNVVMLLSYFYKHTGIWNGKSDLTEENAQRIREWVITLQFQRLLSLQVSHTLSDFRGTIRRLQKHQTDFPLNDVARMFSGNGRHFGFDQEWVDRFCSEELGTISSEKLLSLLYGRDLAVDALRPLPLVQPRYFMPEELRRAGLADALHPSLQQHSNRLILAVALQERECEQYHSLPFQQWVQMLNPEQVDRHLLPNDIHRYTIGDLPELVKQRKKLIGQYLMDRIPEASRQYAVNE